MQDCNMFEKVSCFSAAGWLQVNRDVVLPYGIYKALHSLQCEIQREHNQK